MLVTILELDVKSPSGKIYTFDSIKHLLLSPWPDREQSCCFIQSFHYGEIESPKCDSAEDFERVSRIDQSKICLRIVNMRYDAEKNAIVGTVQPDGPGKTLVRGILRSGKKLYVSPRMIITDMRDDVYVEKVRSIIAVDLAQHKGRVEESASGALQGEDETISVENISPNESGNWHGTSEDLYM